MIVGAACIAAFLPTANGIVANGGWENDKMKYMLYTFTCKNANTNSNRKKNNYGREKAKCRDTISERFF